MSAFAMMAVGGGVAALIIGLLAGAALARRKFNQHYEEVRFEIARLNDIAVKKLSGDDPNVETLLAKLNESVAQAIRAAEALENQSRLIRQKTEGGREIVESSRYVTRMIDDFTGAPPEDQEPDYDAAETKRQPRVTHGAAPKARAPKVEGKETLR